MKILKIDNQPRILIQQTGNRVEAILLLAGLTFDVRGDTEAEAVMFLADSLLALADDIRGARE